MGKKKIIPLAMVLLSLVALYFGSAALKQDDHRPITLAEFNAKIKNSTKPVFVYFSAGWCTICAKMKPTMEAIEQEYAGKIEFYKIDSDRDKQVANEFEISSLPVMVLYNHGERQWIHVGLIQKGQLQSKLGPYSVQKDGG